MIDREEVFGLSVSLIPKSLLVDEVLRLAQSRSSANAYYVNVHSVVTAQHEPDLPDAIRRASLVFLDGFGLKWGARALGTRLGDRMSPPDWIDPLLDRGVPLGLSIFLLGDEDGVAEQCAGLLVSRHPGLKVAGTHQGFFDKHGAANDAVVEAINRSGADILLVGFGTPLQERWMDANRHRLNTRVNVAVGALFRHLIGLEWRGPRWATDHGLEWLLRLVVYPRRYFGRYVIENAIFGGMVARALASRAVRVGR